MLKLWADKLEKLSHERHFRFAIATLLVAFHLFAFNSAAHDRLGLAFNSAPGMGPYFSDPKAPELTPRPPRQPHHWSRLAVSRWDAQHHIAFALRGLSGCPTDPSNAQDVEYADCGLAWFPAFGMTAGVIVSTTGAPADATLVILSCLAALAIGLMWTSKPIIDRIGRGPAWAALFAFNLFPTAFFQVTPYPESVTIALTLGAFLCVIRERWWLAGALAGAATAFEPAAIGIAFGLAAAAFSAAMRAREAKTAQWWRPLVAVPLCIWGVALTFLIYQIVLGDAFVFFRAQNVFASTSDASMWKLLDPVFWIKGMLAENLTVTVLIAVVGILVIVAKDLRRAFKTDELIFLAASGALIVARELSSIAAHGGGYWQLSRYLLACPIIFIAAGLLAKKHRAAFALWLALSFGVYWHVELCSYLSHGHPQVCPCIGRPEAFIPWQS